MACVCVCVCVFLSFFWGREGGGGGGGREREREKEKKRREGKKKNPPSLGVSNATQQQQQHTLEGQKHVEQKRITLINVKLIHEGKKKSETKISHIGFLYDMSGIKNQSCGVCPSVCVCVCGLQ